LKNKTKWPTPQVSGLPKLDRESLEHLLNFFGWDIQKYYADLTLWHVDTMEETPNELRCSYFCESVKLRILGEKNAGRNTYKDALRTIRARSWKEPCTARVKGVMYLKTHYDAALLLRGIVPSTSRLLRLLNDRVDVASRLLTPDILVALRRELMSTKELGPDLSSVVAVVDGDVHWSMSIYDARVPLLELRPLLKLLGYGVTKSSRLWRAVIKVAIQGACVMNHGDEGVTLKDGDVCGRDNLGQRLIVEYQKIHGNSNRTPCISQAALLIALRAVQAITPSEASGPLLVRLLECLGRATTSPPTTAAASSNSPGSSCDRSPNASSSGESPGSSRESSSSSTTSACLKRLEPPLITHETPKEIRGERNARFGSLYLMIAYDRATGAYFAHKIGRSNDPLARVAQCDEESQRRRGGGGGGGEGGGDRQPPAALRHVLLEVWPMAGCVEPHVHRRLKDYHVENEYFDLSSTPERLGNAQAAVERCVSEWPLVEERQLNKIKRMLEDDDDYHAERFEASCKRRRLEADTAAYEERARNETQELAERARHETQELAERARVETQERMERERLETERARQETERAKVETRRVEAIATADVDFANRRLELRLAELTETQRRVELLLRLPRRNAAVEQALARRGYVPLQAPTTVAGGAIESANTADSTAVDAHAVVEYRLRAPTTSSSWTGPRAKRERSIVMSIVARAGVLGPVLPFDVVFRTTPPPSLLSQSGGDDD
jgi:hypothetical protein